MTSTHPAITKDIADIIGKYSAQPFTWLCTTYSDYYKSFNLRGQHVHSFIVRTHTSDKAEAYKCVHELFRSLELTFSSLKEGYYILAHMSGRRYECFHEGDIPQRDEFNGRKLLLHTCTLEEFITMMSTCVYRSYLTYLNISIVQIPCIN